MRSVTGLLMLSIVLSGCARDSGVSSFARLGPMLVKVESAADEPMFDGNQVENWRRLTLRIVGVTSARWEEAFRGKPKMRVVIFDTSDRGGATVCPGSTPGDRIYVVQLKDMRGKARLIDNVRYVLDSCLPYDRNIAYGFALFEGE